MAARRELQRIVASPAFEDSERLVRFLHFVVEETLAGRGGLLKESVVGVEVFGRDPGAAGLVFGLVRIAAAKIVAAAKIAAGSLYARRPCETAAGAAASGSGGAPNSTA